MPIVVPDEGERYLLRQLLIEPVSASAIFRIGLYSNDWQPAFDSTLSDVVQATFAGYAAKTLLRNVWTPPVTVTNYAQSVYGTAFLVWLAASGTQDIHGYYVRDEDSNVLLWAERLPAVIAVSTTVPVRLIPVLRLRSEYDPPV